MVSPTDDREPASPRVLVALFAVMALLVGIDLITDLRGSTTLGHVMLEMLVVVIGFVAAGAIALRLRDSARAAQTLREQAARLAENLRASQEEAAQWRSDAADLIAGLSSAIDAQFTRWS